MARPPPDPLYVFREGMDVVSCVTFGLNDVIYAGTQDGLVHVWDLKTNRKKYSFRAGDSTCLSINACSGDLLTQVKGGLLRFWSVSEEECLKQRELSVSYFGFCKLELHIDSRQSYLYAPSEESVIKIVSIDSFNIVSSLFSPLFNLGEIMTMKQCTLSHNSHLLAGYESGHIFLWGIHKCEHVTNIKLDATPMAIDFDCDKKTGICGTESKQVFVFQLNEFNNLSILKVLTITNPGVSSLLIRKDRKIFVLGCWDGHIRVFSWKSLRLLAVLSGHYESLHDLCFSPQPVSSWNTKYLLAAACKDKSISLWSIYED